jgi:DNA-binding IclR family transcriptional regulator
MTQPDDNSGVRDARPERPVRNGLRAYASLQGVGRAIEVLELVAERPMRAKEIAEALDLKWTTAYRTITYLYEHRYLSRDDASGVHSIGPRLYYLGQSYLLDNPLLAAGAQTLRVLAYETRANAQLNEREGQVATVLIAVDAKLEMIPKTSVEFRFPLHTGSKGQVLLAFSEPEIYEALVRRPLAPLTERSITDPAELRRRLEEIRTQGYAVTREDVQPGTGSVAVPVFFADGELAGSVCLIVQASELTPERTDELVGSAMRAAREISMRLGWRYGEVPAAVRHWATVADG